MSSELEEIKRIVESHKEEKANWEFLRTKIVDMPGGISLYNRLFCESHYTILQNLIDEEFYYRFLKSIIDDHSEAEIMRAAKRINYALAWAATFNIWIDCLKNKSISDEKDLYIIKSGANFSFTEKDNYVGLKVNLNNSEASIRIENSIYSYRNWNINDILNFKLKVLVYTGKALYTVGFPDFKNLTKEWLKENITKRGYL